MITLIYDIQKDDNSVTVKAVVEDCVMTHPATELDPPEYGPALCEASFELEENEILPKDEDDLVDYLETLNLDWEVIPEDDYY
jgi:hypothetical protein